jgi:hypothetical protein
METTAATPTAPAIEEAFVADRMAFWGTFTKFVTAGGIAIAVLLILMAIFLV